MLVTCDYSVTVGTQGQNLSMKKNMVEKTAKALDGVLITILMVLKQLNFPRQSLALPCVFCSE